MDTVSLLAHAYNLAQMSPDPSTQIGAVIVKNGRIIGEGCNTFPNGVSRHPSRFSRPAKYEFIEHAERNAIYDVAKYCTGTWDNCRGAVMYCACGVPCTDCARAVIQSGIMRVVCHKAEGAEDYMVRWNDSVNRGEQMLTEAGVAIEHFSYKFGLTVRRNGELVEV